MNHIIRLTTTSYFALGDRRSCAKEASREVFSFWSPWLPNAAALAGGAALWWRMVKR